MTDYRRSGETYFIAGLELSDDNPVKITHLLTAIGYLLLSLDDRSAAQAAKAEEVRDQLLAFTDRPVRVHGVVQTEDWRDWPGEDGS